MPSKHTRRRFLQRTAAAGLTLWLAPRRFFARDESPKDKLNIGIIGTSGRGAANIDGVKGENIVALCDVDSRLLDAAQGKFPDAKTYADFRALIDQPNLDAVVVSTPDHIHALATMRALKAGLHVYCEKPLTHSVYEARRVAEATRATGRATQMGTQIHASKNYRRVVELVRSGAIGTITECHVWVDKSWGGGDRPTDTPPVPETLNWDLWLGPAPERPYHPTYVPRNWRGWWDFGNGTLGDMGCHYIDLPFWALKLHHPETIEAEGPEPHAETTPAWLIVRWEFPAREELPPLKLTWYDGGRRPEELIASAKLDDKRNGVLFVGSKGMLFSDYSHHALLPEENFKDFQPPTPSIPDSIGHHAEWIEACKTGSATTCDFRSASLLTETVLLGNVAFRSGRKIKWNHALMKTGDDHAQQFLQREYRKGWTL
jgi:predicted dehydrogenase